MTKTIMVTIQIDNVDAQTLGDIEKKIETALKDYKSKRINYNLQDTFGLPIPPTET